MSIFWQFNYKQLFFKEVLSLLLHSLQFSWGKSVKNFYPSSITGRRERAHARFYKGGRAGGRHMRAVVTANVDRAW
jgi:hypothetical protein